MPLPSKYVSPKIGGKGEELRDMLADIVSSVTKHRRYGVNATNLQTFLTEIQADLTTFLATVPTIGTTTVSGDNSVSVAEKASPVPVVAALTNVLAGDVVTVVIFNSAGVQVAATAGSALANGATTATVNVTMTSLPAGNYTARIGLRDSALIERVFKVQAFVIAAV